MEFEGRDRKLVGDVERRYDVDGERYLVRYWQTYTHTVDFEVREIGGTHGDDGSDAFFVDGRPVPKEEAEVFISGHVKWDGCANWTLPGVEKGCMEHACSRSELVSIGTLLGRIFDQCATILGDKVLDGDIGQLPVVEDGR